MSSIKPEKLLPPTPDVLLSAEESVRRRRDPNWGRDEGEIRPESPTGALLLIEAATAAIERRPPAGTTRRAPAANQAMLIPQRASTTSGHARGASGWSLSTVDSGPPELDEESIASLRDSFKSVQSVKMVVWEVQEQHGRPSFTKAVPNQTLCTYALSDCVGVGIVVPNTTPALAHFAGEYAAASMCDQIVAEHMGTEPTKFYVVTGTQPSTWYANEQKERFETKLRAALQRAGHSEATRPFVVELVEAKQGVFTLYPDGRGEAAPPVHSHHKAEAST